MIAATALKALSNWVNRYLSLDPASIVHLQKMTGKVAFIEINGLALNFYIVVQAHGLEFTQTPQTANTAIRGTPLALLRFITTRQAATLVNNQTLALQGDLHFLQELRALFSSLAIDWEEYASHWLGDVAAYKIFQVSRELTAWGTTARQQLRQNISEYLQEELRYFPPRIEVADFYHAVDQLRNDQERLLARITRLAAKISALPALQDQQHA